MDSEAFRLSAAAAQQAYEKELAELKRVMIDEQKDLEGFQRLKSSLDSRHNEKLRDLNLAMTGARPAPVFPEEK